MMTRPAESSGRPLERHGNVSPREMAVEGAKNPGTEPGVQVGPFASNAEGPDDSIGAFSFGSLSLSKGPEPVEGAVAGERGRADDARVVAVDRGDDRRLQVEQRQEVACVLRHAAADHEQVGAEQELDVRVERLQALGPLLPAQALALARRGGRIGLDGLVLAEVQVAELRVREQHAVVQERGADPGAERGQEREAEHVAGGSVAGLRDTGGVGVVHEDDVAAEAVAEEALGVEVDPLLRNVRRGQGLAALDDRGERHAERQSRLVHVERLQDRLHRDEDVFRCRAGRSGHAHPIRGHGAVFEVDDSRFDARAADVDADRFCHGR